MARAGAPADIVVTTEATSKHGGTMRPLTLQQAFDGFLLDKQASGKAAHTMRNYGNTWSKVRLYLEAEELDVARLMLPEIDRELWVGFFAWLQTEKFAPGGVVKRTGRKLSPKTIRNHHTNLSAFYSWAVRLGAAPEHHIRTIERPEYQRPAVDLLTESDVKSLLKACDTTREWATKDHTASQRPTSCRDRAIIMTLLSTGIRASELCDAQRADLDLNENSLKVTGKGRGTVGKERFVYFGQKTRRAIWRYLVEYKEIQERSPLFLVDPGGDPRPMQRRALCTLLKRIGERAGVERVYPHRFRHTFAVNYLRNGGNVFALMRLLGHTSIKMVSHYVQLAQADLAALQRTADPGDNWNL